MNFYNNVWNRRYVDFFVAMAGTLTLSHQQDAGTLQSMVTLVHPIAPYVGVDYFNTLLQNPNSGFLSMFSYSHTGALLGQGVEYTMVGPGPTEVLEHFARPRL